MCGRGEGAGYVFLQSWFEFFFNLPIFPTPGEDINIFKMVVKKLTKALN